MRQLVHPVLLNLLILKHILYLYFLSVEPLSNTSRKHSLFFPQFYKLFLFHQQRDSKYLIFDFLSCGSRVVFLDDKLT